MNSNSNTEGVKHEVLYTKGIKDGVFNPNAFDILKERGFIQITNHEDKLRKAMQQGPITFYLGIDPTADNLHIGHFFALMTFKILQDCGHRGILLLGGATTQIGDPSFKDDIRKLMPADEIDKNAASIKKAIQNYIDVDKTIFVNNADWLRPLKYIDFMRDIGTHFNVAKMLAHECYKVRMREGGLTFFEMGYMMLQSYDYIHLNDKYGCTLQIGGTDQWGNILAGAELGRKISFKDGKERPEMFALATPLLTKSDGQKMGKTEKGVLWISPQKTSVYDFYQYFINAADADVERLLTFFTMMPIKDIKEICKKDIVAAKKHMAYEVTKRIHGEKAATDAQVSAQKLFSGTGDDAPTEIIKTAEKNVVEILALTSIIKSKREAREFIESGAIQIDGERITDINTTINKKEFLLKKGKKTFLKIIIS